MPVLQLRPKVYMYVYMSGSVVSAFLDNLAS